MRKHQVTFIAIAVTFGFSAACGGPPGDGVGRAGPPSSIEARTSALTYGKQLGYYAVEPGADYNRCVKHAPTVLNRMNARGENIGLHYRSAGYTATNGVYWHAQSIVRLPYYWWDSILLGQYFVEDVDHGMDPNDGPDSEGHLGVARLDFTGGNSGRAIGSNKTFNNGSTYGPDWLTAPNPGDSFVPLYNWNTGAWTSKFHVDEVQNHVGGMSGIGWNVAVSLMQWAYDFGGYIPSGSVPLVKIFSHWDPEAPALLQTFTTYVDTTPIYFHGVPVGVQPTGNDAVAITKLADGRFLLVVEKGGNLSRLEFYVSNGTTLDAPNLFGANGREPDKVVAGYPEWTSMNFITDCDTRELYLLGFKNNDTIENKHVEFFQESTAPVFNATLTAPPAEFGVTGFPSKQMNCTDNANQGQCAFTSSAGTYVDPDGKVVIYGMGGDDDGCVSSPSGSLCGTYTVGAPYLIHGNGSPYWGSYTASTGYMRGMEFHERHGNAGENTACPTMDKAWVEFYENADFNSGATDTARNYYVFGNDWNSKPSHDLRLNSFNDFATSVRWCLPAGYSVALYYAVNYGATYTTLSGAGSVRKISTLAGMTFAHGTAGIPLDNNVSSYYIYSNDTDPLKVVGVPDDAL